MALRRLLSISLSLILFSCLGSYGLAQQSSQTGTNGTNSTAGTTNTGSGTGTSTDAGINSRSTTNLGTRSTTRGPLSLFIVGNVALEDGSAPPTGVVIERVCGGQTTKEAYPSPDGSFSFQVGANNYVLQDAGDDAQARIFNPMGSSSGSYSNPMTGSTRLMGCELRAQLGGYRSNVVPLNISQTMGNYNAGTIVLYPAVRVPGTTVSITDMAAPKKARRSLEQGENALKKKDFSGAEKYLDAALAVYPRYALAWFRLGQTYEISHRNGEARNAFAKALEADGNYVGPYIELARMAALEQKWQETADLTDHALKLNPLDFPYGYYLDALSNFYLNRLDTAEKSARMLERLDGQHRYPEVHLLLANVFRRKHDAAGEAAQLWDYLKRAPQAANAPQVRARLHKLAGSGGSS
jgi:tetratricopeptide (TPR) repeat protein